MTLQEMIAAAQKRVNESTDDTAKAKAEAELAALKAVESAGYTKTQDDVNTHAGSSRSEGKEAGEKAQRKAMLDSLGIPDDENADAELARIKKQRDGEKSDAERLRSQVETLTKERDEAKQSASDSAKTIRERDRRDAIYTALDAAGYEGKKGHAYGSVDFSKVEETEGKFDATKAVEALKEDDFPGFTPKAPNNPNPLPQSRRTQTGTSLRERRKQQKEKAS